MTAAVFIEGKAPRIAHAVRINLLAHAAAGADERIVSRDAVLAAGPVRPERIDAKDFAEEPCLVLRVAESIGRARAGIVPAGVPEIVILLAAAVADADVEIPLAVRSGLRSKLELAAVVIGLRLRVSH